MYRQFYSGMELQDLPTFALLLFITVFVSVCIRLFVFQRKGDFDALAALPLEDGAKASMGEVKR